MHNNDKYAIPGPSKEMTDTRDMTRAHFFHVRQNRSTMITSDNDDKYAIPGPSKEMTGTRDMSPAHFFHIQQNRSTMSDDEDSTCSELSDSNEEHLPEQSSVRKLNNPYRFLFDYIRNKRSNVPQPVPVIQRWHVGPSKKSEIFTGLQKSSTAVADVPTTTEHFTLVKESETPIDIPEPSSFSREKSAVATQGGFYTETDPETDGARGGD